MRQMLQENYIAEKIKCCSQKILSEISRVKESHCKLYYKNHDKSLALQKAWCQRATYKEYVKRNKVKIARTKHDYYLRKMLIRKLVQNLANWKRQKIERTYNTYIYKIALNLRCPLVVLANRIYCDSCMEYYRYSFPTDFLSRCQVRIVSLLWRNMALAHNHG